MANRNLFFSHPFLNHHFPSNPVLTGFFAGSGAAGYAPLATAHDTIRMCRALPVLPAFRTLTEQVVS
jgi:3-hydroxymyristoyl/3-hydroxydecanoyl-(acyl carrier protein) dehydratase